MGASQAVVVEQLWMRGSVESQMLRPQEIKDKLEEKIANVLTSPARINVQEGDSPGKSPKKPNTGGGTMFTAPNKKRKRHRVAGDARKAAKGNKNTFLQRKLDYVLNNLRLLGENIVAEAGQVRFRVVDECEEVIRQAVHVMPFNRTSRGVTPSTAPAQPPTTTQAIAVAPSPSTIDTPARPRSSARRSVTFEDERMPSAASHVPMPKRPALDDIITISSSSSDEEELKETSDNDDEQDDIEATRMVQNARRRWAKRRSIIAAMSSSDDDDDNNEVKPPPLKAMATVNGKLNGNGIVRRETKVSSKAKAVSFAIIDDDDSDTESE
ncbi:hypothetical protein ON010_g3131 [Phytophthora cinnamomi]|nr:hypothetical protein ON010_g3131 [Phytophthora cinnamomi]